MTRPSDTRGYRRRLAGALACALVLTVLAGCGAREGIPRDDAKSIENALEDVQNQFRDGECATLTGTGLPGLQDSVAALPRKVDQEIRTVLSDAVADLDRLAVDCEEPEPVVPEITTTQPTTTVPTVEETTTDEETTTEEEPPPLEEEPPPLEEEIPDEKPGNGPKLKPPKGDFPDAPVEDEDDG